MNITISLEELVNHDKAIQAWLSLRADVQWDLLRRGRSGASSIRENLVKWEKENPRPTLIPYNRDVVEYRFRYDDENGSTKGSTEFVIDR